VSGGGVCVSDVTGGVTSRGSPTVRGMMSRGEGLSHLINILIN